MSVNTVLIEEPSLRCPACGTELVFRTVTVNGKLVEIVKCYECGYTDDY